ncbi:MAG: hypothetical protein ACP5U2_15100, partial [Bryobacteraceae bacterium]
ADALRELERLRGQLRELPGEARELDEILREYARYYDPRRAPGNPELLERIRARFLADLDRLELQWRRRMGEAGEQARSVADQPVPAKYAEAIADYFRRLSGQR